MEKGEASNSVNIGSRRYNHSDEIEKQILHNSILLSLYARWSCAVDSVTIRSSHPDSSNLPKPVPLYSLYVSPHLSPANHTLHNFTLTSPNHNHVV